MTMMLNALIFKPSRAPSLPAKSMAFACALLVLSVVAIDANASTAYPVNDEQKQSKISQTATEKSSPNGQVTQSVSVTELLVTQGQNRITMAIIGDGYTASDLITKYQPKVTSTLDYFFNNLEKSTPYPRYKNFINLYRIDIPSNESGVDKLSAGIYRDTALGGEDGCTDYTIGICGADWALTHAAFDLAEAAGYHSCKSSIVIGAFTSSSKRSGRTSSIWVISCPSCKPQSPKCTSLTTSCPANSSRLINP